ncbi:hypothetical protein GUJ93_ZPchr0005g15611 [Zizania palustris]|uniref:Uncharacterized protein n=1 Tax=Zizania palustris TaxID=103762 RepID=A0A8J5W223_ZIZPA|nr:hypothetical protein GUJ93_ZPchr0005g15611 [Zizania palustris]
MHQAATASSYTALHCGVALLASHNPTHISRGNLFAFNLEQQAHDTHSTCIVKTLGEKVVQAIANQAKQQQPASIPRAQLPRRFCSVRHQDARQLQENVQQQGTQA